MKNDNCTLLKFIGLIISIFINCMITIAQVESIITDRPDQTESPAIVPAEYLQFEHGFSVEINDDVNTYSVFSSLIRFGVNENFELRMELHPHIYDSLQINDLRLDPVSICI